MPRRERRLVRASLSSMLWAFPMTRYFFHVRRGRLTIFDHCGLELADFVEAVREAVRRVLEIEATAADPLSTDAVLVDDGSSTILEVPLTGLRNEPESVPWRSALAWTRCVSRHLLSSVITQTTGDRDMPSAARKAKAPSLETASPGGRVPRT